VKDLRQGDLIAGRFRVEAPLGRDTWRALDLERGSPVALKLAPVPCRLERLLRLSALTHPHLARVFEVGQHQGRLFLAAEMAQGPTLAEYRRSRPRGLLTAEEGEAVLKDLCGALRYLHEQGLVHGDVRPERAFWVRGVLKLSEPALEPGEGPAAYRAPETWRGPAAPPADVYALGVLGCEILTGSPSPSLEGLPAHCRSLLAGCLAPDEEQRWTARQAWEHLACGPEVERGQWPGIEAPSFWRQLVQLPCPEGSHLWSAAFSPDGRLVAAGAAGGRLLVWDAQSGRLLYRREGLGMSDPAGSHVYCVRFSPDGQWLACSALGGAIYLVEISSGTERLAAHAGCRCPWAIDFSPDSRFLALASDEPTVLVWNLATGAPELSISLPLAPDQAVRAVRFSPCGQRLAWGCDDGRVYLTDLEGRRGTGLAGHEAPVRGLDFDPEGRMLASASEDGTVRLWDVARREEEGVLRPQGLRQPAWLHSLAFAPDGRTLAVGSGQQGVVVFWDVASRSELYRLDGLGVQAVHALAICPQGESLVLAGKGLALLRATT
jgi:hypothetical protein